MPNNNNLNTTIIKLKRGDTNKILAHTLSDAEPAFTRKYIVEDGPQIGKEVWDNTLYIGEETGDWHAVFTNAKDLKTAIDAFGNLAVSTSKILEENKIIDSINNLANYNKETDGPVIISGLELSVDGRIPNISSGTILYGKDKYEIDSIDLERIAFNLTFDSADGSITYNDYDPTSFSKRLPEHGDLISVWGADVEIDSVNYNNNGMYIIDYTEEFTDENGTVLKFYIITDQTTISTHNIKNQMYPDTDGIKTEFSIPSGETTITADEGKIIFPFIESYGRVSAQGKWVLLRHSETFRYNHYNSSGTEATLLDENFGLYWVFLTVTGKIFVSYGSQYGNLEAAEGVTEPSPPTLENVPEGHEYLVDSTLIGRVIFQKGAEEPIKVDNYRNYNVREDIRKLITFNKEVNGVVKISGFDAQNLPVRGLRMSSGTAWYGHERYNIGGINFSGIIVDGIVNVTTPNVGLTGVSGSYPVGTYLKFERPPTMQFSIFSSTPQKFNIYAIPEADADDMINFETIDSGSNSNKIYDLTYDGTLRVTGDSEYTYVKIAETGITLPGSSFIWASHNDELTNGHRAPIRVYYRTGGLWTFGQDRWGSKYFAMLPTTYAALQSSPGSEFDLREMTEDHYSFYWLYWSPSQRTFDILAHTAEFEDLNQAVAVKYPTQTPPQLSNQLLIAKLMYKKGDEEFTIITSGIGSAKYTSLVDDDLEVTGNVTVGGHIKGNTGVLDVNGGLNVSGTITAGNLTFSGDMALRQKDVEGFMIEGFGAGGDSGYYGIDITNKDLIVFKGDEEYGEGLNLSDAETLKITLMGGNIFNFIDNGSTDPDHPELDVFQTKTWSKVPRMVTFLNISEKKPILIFRTWSSTPPDSPTYVTVDNGEPDYDPDPFDSAGDYTALMDIELAGESALLNLMSGGSSWAQLGDALTALFKDAVILLPKDTVTFLYKYDHERKRAGLFEISRSTNLNIFGAHYETINIDNSFQLSGSFNDDESFNFPSFRTTGHKIISRPAVASNGRMTHPHVEVAGDSVSVSTKTEIIYITAPSSNSNSIINATLNDTASTQGGDTTFLSTDGQRLNTIFTITNSSHIPVKFDYSDNIATGNVNPTNKNGICSIDGKDVLLNPGDSITIMKLYIGNSGSGQNATNSRKVQWREIFRTSSNNGQNFVLAKEELDVRNKLLLNRNSKIMIPADEEVVTTSPVIELVTGATAGVETGNPDISSTAFFKEVEKISSVKNGQTVTFLNGRVQGFGNQATSHTTASTVYNNSIRNRYPAPGGGPIFSIDDSRTSNFLMTSADGVVPTKYTSQDPDGVDVDYYIYLKSGASAYLRRTESITFYCRQVSAAGVTPRIRELVEIDRNITQPQPIYVPIANSGGTPITVSFEGKNVLVIPSYAETIIFTPENITGTLTINGIVYSDVYTTTGKMIPHSKVNVGNNVGYFRGRKLTLLNRTSHSISVTRWDGEGTESDKYGEMRLSSSGNLTLTQNSSLDLLSSETGLTWTELRRNIFSS